MIMNLDLWVTFLNNSDELKWCILSFYSTYTFTFVRRFKKRWSKVARNLFGIEEHVWNDVQRNTTKKQTRSDERSLNKIIRSRGVTRGNNVKFRFYAVIK